MTEDEYVERASADFGDFLPKSAMTLHRNLWEVMNDCTKKAEQQPAIDEIVQRLARIIASRPPSTSDSTSALWTESGDSSHPLVDLSSEIRRVGSLPIAGGGFCDIWLGERLGQYKVALKVLKMFGAPDQLRRVSEHYT